MPPFFQFGSWIGGDRDGNPYVTSEVTRQTAWSNRLASLNRYRQRLIDLIRNLSIAEHALPLPADFAEALRDGCRGCPRAGRWRRAMRGSRSASTWASMLARVEHTAHDSQRQRPAPDSRGYRSADQVLDDLDRMISALSEAGAGQLAKSLLLPFRREVTVFRFSTVRLDVRENSVRMNQALAAIYRASQGGRSPRRRLGRMEGWLLASWPHCARSAVSGGRTAARSGRDAARRSRRSPNCATRWIARLSGR